MNNHNNQSFQPSSNQLKEKQDNPKNSLAKKMLYGGLFITFWSPLAGLVLGGLLWSEPGLKKQGKVILFFALLWSIVFLLAAEKGYLPFLKAS